MNKAGLIMIILVLASVLYLGLMVFPGSVRAKVFYVGGIGPSNYTSIQKAIDSAESGDTVYVYSGTYRERLRVDKTLDLIGEDRTMTVIDGGGTGDVVSVNADWVLITGFTLTNSGNLVGDSAIEVYSSRNCVIVGNVISSSFHGLTLYNSSHIKVSDNEISDIRYNGILLYHSSNITISSNVMTGDGIHIKGDSLEHWVTHTISSSNSVNGKPIYYWKNVVGGSVPSGAGQVVLANSTHVVVRDQNVSRTSVGILLGFSSYNVISNNNASSNGNGIVFQFSHHNTLTNSSASWSRGYGISLYDSDNNTLLNNSASANYGNGLALDSSRGNYLANSNVSYNTACGISLYESSGNTIVGGVAWHNKKGVCVTSSDYNAVIGTSIRWNRKVNIEVHYSRQNLIGDSLLAGSWEYGIYLFRADNNTISGNVVTSNEIVGVRLGESAHNTIVNNSILFNRETGALLLTSNENTIFNNTFRANFIKGLSLVSSLGNLMYHNNFIENEIQAFDDGNNSWEREYPVGGNYWSDYLGVDVRKGANQDQVGGDGMGDTPYEIPGGRNEDGYPLWLPAPPPWPPLAPSSLEALPEDGQVVLIWQPPTYNGTFPVTNYRVYRGNESGEETFLTEVGNVIGYNDTDLVNGHKYFYRVSAVNSVGEGPQSDEVGATPTTIPGPPSFFEAVLTGDHLEDVTLRWDLSIDDGAGQNSVVGYRIFRNASYNGYGLDYEPVAFLPRGTKEFVDLLAGVGNSNNYFYQVCAVDLNERTMCAQNQSAKFTRPLSLGLNLVSIPLVQSDESFESVLQTVSYDELWFYQTSTQGWGSLWRLKPYFRGLGTINHTIGFWLNVTRASNLTVAGILPTETVIHLSAGWNLVGFPSFVEGYTIGDMKASVPVERVEGFDALALPFHLRVLQDSDSLRAGQGYWVRCSTETLWTIRDA